MSEPLPEPPLSIRRLMRRTSRAALGTIVPDAASARVELVRLVKRAGAQRAIL